MKRINNINLVKQMYWRFFMKIPYKIFPIFESDKVEFSKFK